MPSESYQDKRERHVFSLIMESFSRPGNWNRIECGLSNQEDTLFLIASSLFDSTCSIWSPNSDQTILDHLSTLDCQRLQTSEQCDFFIVSDEHDFPLSELGKLSVGTLLEPHISPTLIINIRDTKAIQAHISGPGIQNEISISLPYVDHSFWSIRNDKCTYPLGWDILFYSTSQMMGIPRSTIINLDNVHSS